LTENEYFAGFAKRANMPVIIVATTKLGTLNHTLLTVMACEKFGLKITGIILNKISKKPSIVEQKTAEVIERLIHVKVLALVPFSQEVNYAAIGKVLEHDLDLDKLLSM
jgi:dethiobiotin synthetase